MKRRRPSGTPDAAAAQPTPAAAPGKRPRTGGAGAGETPAATGGGGFYPMPAAAADPGDDPAPPSFAESLIAGDDDWRARLVRLESELHGSLERHDQLERRVRAGDAGASHALRQERARILALADRIGAIDPEHPLLRRLPPELVADAGAGATVEELVRAGRDDATDAGDDMPGVAPMLCEDEGVEASASACWLDPIERTRVVGLLADRAETSANRWLAAVEHGVTDELLNNHAGWDMVAEVLFNIASFGVTGVIARTAAALSRTRLPSLVQHALTKAADPRNIKDTVSILGKGAREKLKAAVTIRPRVSKIEVLMSLRDLPGSWKDEVQVAALTVLDDADLLAVTAALQPDRPELSSDAYDARVHDMVERFERNVLAVGRVGQGGHVVTAAARIVGPAGARMALVRYEDQHLVRTGGDADMMGDDRLHFVEWIDTDFAPSAAERQEALFRTTFELRAGDRMLANPDHPALVRWFTSGAQDRTDHPTPAPDNR